MRLIGRTDDAERVGTFNLIQRTNAPSGSYEIVPSFDPTSGRIKLSVDLRAQSAGHKRSRGIALITIAFLCSAVMSALSKAASGAPPLMILFLQYAISFSVYVPAAVASGAVALETRHIWLQLFRSLAGAVCQLLFFFAVGSIPLLDSVLLSNAAPLFIPIVVYVWFRKAVQPLVWVSLLIGLAGVVMIIKPGPQLFHNPASLIALVAGLFSSLALVATNKLAETEPPVRILIYNFGFSTLALIPFCIWAWKPLNARIWLLLIGVGVCYAATQYLIIRAYRYASATELSPFNYSVVIFSGILGWWFFGNVPDGMAIIGTVLICAGGILSIEAGHSEGQGHAFGNGHWKSHWTIRSATPGFRDA
jgi:drug/metabolite transporter (DMT)-like permease